MSFRRQLLLLCNFLQGGLILLYKFGTSAPVFFETLHLIKDTASTAERTPLLQTNTTVRERLNAVTSVQNIIRCISRQVTYAEYCTSSALSRWKSWEKGVPVQCLLFDIEVVFGYFIQFLLSAMLVFSLRYEFDVVLIVLVCCGLSSCVVRSVFGSQGQEGE